MSQKEALKRIQKAKKSQKTTLDLSDLKLESLPTEIGQLTNLQELNLLNNQLSSLPAEIKALTKLKELYLHENQELNIPPEILGSTFPESSDTNLAASPSDILAYYFSVSTEDVKILNEAKIILVGQGSVGKTSLVKQLLGEEFNKEEKKTEGIEIRHLNSNSSDDRMEIHSWAINSSNERIDLNIWDFGGQEIMHATHQFFLTKRSLYILVLDSRIDAKSNRIDYWLKMIESFGGDSPIIIVCNKCDQEPMDLDWERLKRKFPNISACVNEVSCETGEGIDQVKGAIKKEIQELPHVGDKLPATWFAVKDRLTTMKNAGDLDYMALEKYREICVDNGIEDEKDQDSLVNFLNDLGTLLHYGQHSILKDLNILNPEWVTDCVYRILNDPELLRIRDGILHFNYLSKILESTQYPTNAYDFVLKMMKKFELCFEFEEGKGEKFLIPDLLSQKEKDTGDWSDSLQFQFKYEILSGSIITRFIVRMNAYISKDTFWKTGVVLVSEDGKNRALIRSDEDDGVISIFVSGKDQGRREFLSIIRAEFRNIHSRPRLKGIEERVPLPDNPIVTVSYKHLRLLESKGIDEYIPEGSEEPYSVRQLLEGIEPEPSRQFDVFLCHNSQDKKDVKEIDKMLREKGLQPWLDERDLRPGKSWQRGLAEQIRSIKSAAVFVGEEGIGPWQNEEIEAFLIEFNKRKCPVIPVILSNCTSVPELPVFLGTKHWVDFRKKEPDPLAQLIWAITGKKLLN